MARTGTFFQMARGRAMVRTRAMRSARAIRRAIDLVIDGRGDSAAMRILGASAWSACRTTDQVIFLLRAQIGYQVGRARRANDDWRKYRALSKELD